MKKQNKEKNAGRLKIGDDWNAITIIALSQNNPLKAIAEFIENSIDANSANITIIRGKEAGNYYLKIIDDGDGIPKNDDGAPDFKYVATHIGDSIKRRLKKEGLKGIQGEFGIGLLSFWTVGQELHLTSSGNDGRSYRMIMKKGEPNYSITHVRSLFSQKGTELLIKPVLPGVKLLNGEKIQNYLASELRDRIKSHHVSIKIIDRYSRKEYKVEPRKFSGRLLHNITPDSFTDEIYLELYLNEPSAENKVNLSKLGTRIMPDIAKLDFFNNEVWNSGCLQGIIDANFLQLTPGTRDGIVLDESYDKFCRCMKGVSEKLKLILEEYKKAEEDEANKNILIKVQKALKEAFQNLPKEEYDWFKIYGQGRKSEKKDNNENENSLINNNPLTEEYHEPAQNEQKMFFEFPGLLYSVIINPKNSIIKVGDSKTLRASARDKNRRVIDSNVSFEWQIVGGDGRLDKNDGELITFTGLNEPCIAIIQAKAVQGSAEAIGQAVITVTDSIIREQNISDSLKKGLPGYTFKYSPGKLWRSNFDELNNIIIINSGHSDFIYASKINSRKIKYIFKLYAKELILANFKNIDKEELLERFVELYLYAEDYLK